MRLLKVVQHIVWLIKLKMENFKFSKVLLADVRVGIM